MKKVAIITLYGDYNLGNKLQNYAVEYLLKTLGCAPKTIVVSMNQSLKRRIKYFLLDMISMLPVWKDRRIVEHRMMGKRCKTISKFSNELLHCSDRIDYGNSAELKQLSEVYDLFITGSDQVWGSFVDYDKDAFNYYFLRFVSWEKRGSLAPSLGRNTIPKERINEYDEAFSGIRWLSCRERGAKGLIKEVSGREAELLLDPTMAVPVEVWRRIARRPNYDIPSQYILDYRLGTNKDDTDRIVRKISQNIEMETINIYNTKTENSIFESTGPAEFLWLIDNASLVVTDSFNGCVFAILFNKDFVCLDRVETAESVDMSDRLETLLVKFGLEKRIFCEDMLANIFGTDYSFSNNIISQEVLKTRDFLKNMINS